MKPSCSPDPDTPSGLGCKDDAKCTADGRSPDLRVEAFSNLPKPKPAQWYISKSLTAHSCGGSHGFGARWLNLTVFPFHSGRIFAARKPSRPSFDRFYNSRQLPPHLIDALASDLGVTLKRIPLGAANTPAHKPLTKRHSDRFTGSTYSRAAASPIAPSGYPAANRRAPISRSQARNACSSKAVLHRSKHWAV